MIEVAERDLVSLRRAPATAGAKLPRIEQVINVAGSWATILLGSDASAQRDVLAALVDQVVPVRERHGIYRAGVTWTPFGKALRGSLG